MPLRVAGAAAFGMPYIRRAIAAGDDVDARQFHALADQPLSCDLDKGGAAFAKSVGADYVTLVTEGNSEKGIADIKAILQTGGN